LAGIAPDGADFDIEAYVVENDIDYVFFLAECNYYALENIFQVLPQ
jgi:methylglyoxal synthase